ncbi:conserved hypothetical protein, partial [Streptomyces sp. e14]
RDRGTPRRTAAPGQYRTRRGGVRADPRRPRHPRLLPGRLAADARAGGGLRRQPRPRLRTRPRPALPPRPGAQPPPPRRPAGRPMAVEAEPLTEAPADLPALLAARGLRVPSPDEWEHACGAGAGTLFRWGDECPLDRDPYGDPTGPHHTLSAFGLRIAHDPYSAELTGDPTAVHGGDGGEAVCGGYGALLAWLPLATAHRNPFVAEFVHGPDGEDVYDAFFVRPVLAL